MSRSSGISASTAEISRNAEPICGKIPTKRVRRFDHLFYHFVLAYSNWETGTICFSESFESLSLGLQNTLWELGRLALSAVPSGPV